MDVPSVEPHFLSNGLQVPGFVLQENVDAVKDLQLFPDDVWIAGYPKSGTHWVGQIARLIKNRGVQDEVKLDSAIWKPEAGALKYFRVQDVEMARPRLLRSHFQYDLFPCGLPHTTPCKYIHVARNPKDVSVSYFFYLKQGWIPDLEWDGFFEKFVQGDMFYGDYFDHLFGWLPHKDDKNVLHLRYEDMKKDLLQAVSDIASFMEIDLSGETVAKIAKLTTFDTMSKDNTANLSWRKNFRGENGEGTFMRKGIVGDWKNFLSAEQSTRMEKKFAEKLGSTDYKFEYE